MRIYICENNLKMKKYILSVISGSLFLINLIKMRKVILSFVGLVVFYVLAISSSVNRLQSIPSSQNSASVKTSPKIKNNYKNKVFCVLPNELLIDSKRNDIESTLANNQVQVVDIQNAKQIYLEQKLKNNTTKTQIDYYVYVEESDENNYYYQLIDARDFKVAYARQIKTFSYENLMAPFLGFTHEIDLSFIKFFKTKANNDYNNLVESKNNEMLKKRSAEIIAEGKGKSFPTGSKSKDEQNYFNDYYAVLLNAASLNLLARDFTSCQEALKIATSISSKTSANFSREDVYISQLTNTALKWSAAIEDSVNSIVPEKELSKLSINISNDCYPNGRSNKAGLIDHIKKLMYSHVVTVLFSTKSHMLDIYERDLIDNILNANTEVTQKAIGASLGADYLLSIIKNSWVNQTKKLVTYEKGADGKQIQIVKYQYNIDNNVSVKITRNEDATIAGVTSLIFTRKDVANGLVDYKTPFLFSKLFDDGKLNDFIKNTIK